jgi:hypothetical protein
MNDIKKKRQLIDELEQMGVSIDSKDLLQFEVEEERAAIVDYFTNQLADLNSLAERLQESVRVVIDLDPFEGPKIGVTELEFDELTAKFPEQKSQPTRRVLVVTTPDRSTRTFTSAVDGLIWFVNEVGIEPIAKLNLIFRQNKPLLSRQEPDDGFYYPLTDGWYLHTDGAKFATSKLINRISKLLNLGFSAKREKVVIE